MWDWFEEPDCSRHWPSLWVLRGKTLVSLAWYTVYTPHNGGFFVYSSPKPDSRLFEPIRIPLPQSSPRTRSLPTLLLHVSTTFPGCRTSGRCQYSLEVTNISCIMKMNVDVVDTVLTKLEAMDRTSLPVGVGTLALSGVSLHQNTRSQGGGARGPTG